MTIAFGTTACAHTTVKVVEVEDHPRRVSPDGMQQSRGVHDVIQSRRSKTSTTQLSR